MKVKGGRERESGREKRAGGGRSGADRMEGWMGSLSITSFISCSLLAL